MTTSRYASNNRIGRTMLSGAALAMLAALAAGCSTVGTSDVNPVGHDYRLRHPIMISDEPEVLDLPVGMKDGGRWVDLEEEA